MLRCGDAVIRFGNRWSSGRSPAYTTQAPIASLVCSVIANLTGRCVQVEAGSEPPRSPSPLGATSAQRGCPCSTGARLSQYQRPSAFPLGLKRRQMFTPRSGGSPIRTFGRSGGPGSGHSTSAVDPNPPIRFLKNGPTLGPCSLGFASRKRTFVATGAGHEATSGSRQGGCGPQG